MSVTLVSQTAVNPTSYVAIHAGQSTLLHDDPTYTTLCQERGRDDEQQSLPSTLQPPP